MNRKQNINKKQKQNKNNNNQRRVQPKRKVKQPIQRRQPIQRSNRPNQNVQIGRSYQVNRTEVLTEINFETTALQGGGLGINPGNAALFKWLSSLSVLYRNYKFLSLQFIYKPVCSTFKNGQLVMYFAEDDDQMPVDLATAKMTQPNVQTNIIRGARLSVPSYALNRLKQYYIRHVNDSDPNEEKDPRLHEVGFFGWFAQGDVGPAGTIMVSYRVELIYPKVINPTFVNLAQPSLLNTAVNDKENNTTNPPYVTSTLQTLLNDKVHLAEDLSIQESNIVNQYIGLLDKGLLNVLQVSSPAANQLKFTFKEDFTGQIKLQWPIRIQRSYQGGGFAQISDWLDKIDYDSSTLGQSYNLVSDVKASPIASTSTGGNSVTQHTQSLLADIYGIFTKGSWVNIILKTGVGSITGFDFASYFTYQTEYQPTGFGTASRKRSIFSLLVVPMARQFIESLVENALK